MLNAWTRISQFVYMDHQVMSCEEAAGERTALTVGYIRHT